MKLNIPELTLGELAQLDRHGTVNTKVLVCQVQFPLKEANLLLKFIYPSLCSNTKNDNITNFMYSWGKLNCKFKTDSPDQNFRILNFYLRVEIRII